MSGRTRHDSDSDTNDAADAGDRRREGAPANTTVYRDPHGRIVDVAEVEDERTKRERLRTERRLRDQEWAKGNAQERMRQDDAAARPFTGTVDDKGLNEQQKEKLHWDDPALQFKKSLQKGTAKDDTSQVYRGHWAPNRFNIPPGYRWDGVDRSTGFEEKYFLEINKKKSQKDAAYKWSTEDM